MTPLESYQQSALFLIGLRRRQEHTSVPDFISHHKSAVEDLLRRWDQLESKAGTPTPEQVVSWL